MRKRTVLLTLLAFMGLSVSALHAQAVVTIVTTGGDEHSVEVDASGKIIISSESIAIYANSLDIATYSFDLDNVRKLLFTDVVDIQTVEAGPQITLYPNPVDNSFTVMGWNSDEPCLLSLYSMSGAEVLRTRYRQGERVDISTLPAGTYLVRIGESVGKIIKQ